MIRRFDRQILFVLGTPVDFFTGIDLVFQRNTNLIYGFDFDIERLDKRTKILDVFPVNFLERVFPAFRNTVFIKNYVALLVEFISVKSCSVDLSGLDKNDMMSVGHGSGKSSR